MDFYEILFRGIPESKEVYPPREIGDAWWAYAREKYFKHSYTSESNAPGESSAQHNNPPQPAKEIIPPVVATALTPTVEHPKEEPSTPCRAAAVAPAPPPVTSAPAATSAPRKPAGFRYRAFRTVPHAMENLLEQLRAARNVFAPYPERFSRTTGEGVRRYAGQATIDALWREMLAKDPDSKNGALGATNKFRATAEDIQIRLEQAVNAHSNAAAATTKQKDGTGTSGLDKGGAGTPTERQAWEMDRAKLFCERILKLASRAETQSDACEELVEVLDSAIVLLQPRGKQSKEATEKRRELDREGDQAAAGSMDAGSTDEADRAQGTDAWGQP